LKASSATYSIWGRFVSWCRYDFLL